MRNILYGIVFFLLSSMVFAIPPGLQNRVMNAPSFLGQTPPGWDQGVKRGWDKNSDWRWNKETNLWENKDWQWDRTTRAWVRRP